MHGLHLSEKNNLSFKQICDKKAVVIQYDHRDIDIDIEVYDNKLVKRSNDDPGGYWPWKGPSVKMPDYRRTDTVGETELISTFIERSNITDVTWVPIGNVSILANVLIMKAPCYVNSAYCVAPNRYDPRYIWTAPKQQGLNM